MATNPNMVAIQTVTVGAGGASSITFSNIPQTYTDLLVKVCARTDRASVNDIMLVSFNSSTSSFSSRYLEGNGSSAGSYTDQARGFGNAAGGNATANTFGNSELYIPNYTSANNKSYSGDGVEENNATAAYNSLFAGLWSNTAAITSISITGNSSNFVQYSTATLYGITSSAYGAKATGGIITSDANYYYHTFLASGTFTPTSNITADYLVVAGGGGGAGSGAGGGAGGLRSTVTATGGGGSLETAFSATNGTAYTVTVGGGGSGYTSGASPRNGGNGNNSSISGTGLTTITSTGGGGGGGADSGNGQNGGSGGGGNDDATTVGTGTANQGYNGGAGGARPAPSYHVYSGGGGGAGAVGGNATSGTSAGNGGNGVATSISGSSVTYAGGGGGYTSSGTQGTGGTGGGGAGSSGAGTAGTANLGGGGGGGQFSSGGGNGGSGIVIVRYAK